MFTLKQSVVLGLSTLLLGGGSIAFASTPLALKKNDWLAWKMYYPMPDFFRPAPSHKIVKIPVLPQKVHPNLPTLKAERPKVPVQRVAIVTPSAAPKVTHPIVRKQPNTLATVPKHRYSKMNSVIPLQASFHPIIKQVPQKSAPMAMLAAGLSGLQEPETSSTGKIPPLPIRKQVPLKAPAKHTNTANRMKDDIQNTLNQLFGKLSSREMANDSMLLKSGITATANEVELTLGKAKILNLKAPAARIAISNPEIASAVVISPTQVQLIGKKVGVANLLVWDDEVSARHTVVDIAVHRDVSVLGKQLKLIDPGIQVAPMAADDTVILNGETESSESAQLAVELAKAFFTGEGDTGSSAPKVNSQTPGSAIPIPAPKVINLIKIKGQPSTKLELVRSKLTHLDPNIHVDLVPGADGTEKIILTGRVSSAGVISKAINTVSVFYGQPGLKIITGPGGSAVRNMGSEKFFDGKKFTDNMDINILQGSIVTDTSGNVISLMEVAIKPQIRCNVKFLDVSRQALKQLGHTVVSNRNDVAFGNFSGAQTAASGKTIGTFGGGSSVTTSASGDADGDPISSTKRVVEGALISQTLGSGITQAFTINQHMLVGLSALQEQRKVRSLAEPVLTFMSGEKASFLAGGELPIPVAGANGTITIEYHEFGIRLNIIGTVTDDHKIQMLLAPEVSSVDSSNSISTTLATIPGFRTRRMQTTLELNNGESFILAGLFNQEETSSFSHFPGVGKMPILGNLFGGRYSDKRDNELVVLIRPEVIYSSNTGMAPMSPLGTPLKTSFEKPVQEISRVTDMK